MGEAKRRGTPEQRKADAIERAAEAERIEAEGRARIRREMTPEQIEAERRRNGKALKSSLVLAAALGLLSGCATHEPMTPAQEAAAWCALGLYGPGMAGFCGDGK